VTHLKKFTRPETLLLSSEAAISILLDFKKSRWLSPFLAQPQSLQKAAKQLGVSMGSYSYWLKQLLEHDLVFVAFEQKRRGRAVKYYWGAAERFEFALNDAVVNEVYGRVANKYLNDILKSLGRTLRHEASEFTAAMDFDKQGELNFRIRRHKEAVNLGKEMLRPEQPALFVTSREMQLSFKDAKDLQSALYDLLASYETRTNPKGRTYVVQVGLTELIPI